MDRRTPFNFGVIEGFFGQPWLREHRKHVVSRLAALGYSSFIYAPKADHSLRKNWFAPWEDAQIEFLQELSSYCRGHGVRFGVGLSPVEAYRSFDAEKQKSLLQKLHVLESDVGIDELGILFDDMRGDIPDLGKRQAEIVEVVRQATGVERMIVCPTYYSTSKVLEKVFGERAENYWRELGLGVSPEVEFFWTGEAILTAEYSRSHLAQVAEWLQRKPTLWDNYPVNDTKKLSDLIPLEPFPYGRKELEELTQGHFSNPLKQACLSLIPLATLPLRYQEDAPTAEKMKEFSLSCWDERVRTALLEDWETFNKTGLSNLEPSQRAELRARYNELLELYEPAQGVDAARRDDHYTSSHLAIREILLWLDGQYEFDPNCLTD